MVNVKFGKSDQSKEGLRGSLDLAVEALRSLGGGVRLVDRCRKYLQTLVSVAASIGRSIPTPLRAVLNQAVASPPSLNGHGSSNTLAWSDGGNAQDNSDKAVNCIGRQGGDETGLSPLGIDLGEFLTEESLDFMHGFRSMVGSSTLSFDFPFQGY